MSKKETRVESISDFVDDGLRAYSVRSLVRGIPFIGDGFKDVHRKALWGMLKRGENADLDTVERISAYAASATDYHHGVGSMEGTLVTLSRSFPGTNNIPLLKGKGQFGTRLDTRPAASRYISTKLSPSFRMLFPKDDDLILEQLVSNGMKVQPRFFIPLLPLVLVNGAEGLATGHSCYICPYNPAELKEAVLKVIDGKKLKPNSTVPFFNGFKGRVERSENGQISCYGVYEYKGGRKPTLTITELPIGMTSESYKVHLHTLEDKGKIVGFDNLSDKNGFDFRIQLPPDFSMTGEEILKTFKLVSRETENLTLWDKDGFIKKFDTIEDIIIEWTEWRLEQTEARRQALMLKIKEDILWANQKVKFIKYYLANTKYFRETPNKELIPVLIKEGFDRYDELLAMPMRNLTFDKINELMNDVKQRETELEVVKSETAQVILKRDLKGIKL